MANFCIAYVSVKREVKVVRCTFIQRGVPVSEDAYPGPLAGEVKWPVPFLATFYLPGVATRYPFTAG